jgi:hypothetical protein
MATTSICGDGMCPWVPCVELERTGKCEHNKKFMEEIAMGERYTITGSQIGVIKAMAMRSRFGGKEILEVVKDVEEQFIGKMEEPYEDYEIIIQKKIR